VVSWELRYIEMLNVDDNVGKGWQPTFPLLLIPVALFISPFLAIPPYLLFAMTTPLSR
jgi:hypothetical protein